MIIYQNYVFTIEKCSLVLAWGTLEKLQKKVLCLKGDHVDISVQQMRPLLKILLLDTQYDQGVMGTDHDIVLEQDQHHVLCI